MLLNTYHRLCPHRVFYFARFYSILSKRKHQQIQIGEQIPDINVYENSPDSPVNMRELFSGKKGVLFSVPGAFIPGCTKGHIPEYLSHAAKFREEGVDILACISVNDPFVLRAWHELVDPRKELRMLADMKCEFTQAIGMSLDSTSLLGNIRCRRYSLIIEDSIVRYVNHEPDDLGLACLLCIDSLKANYKQN